MIDVIYVDFEGIRMLFLNLKIFFFYVKIII